MKKRLWISWEDHRRSRELAHEFECDFKPLISHRSRALRYPVLSIRTLVLIYNRRPDYLFCQNPSIILSCLCILLKSIFRYTIIVDRHSNFKFDKIKSSSLKWRIFHALSDYSIRNADLTIVTNEYLKGYIEKKGGASEVLQDKIPKLDMSSTFPYLFKNKNEYNIVCVTTFDEDEPIDELLDVARKLRGWGQLYMTGKISKRFGEKYVKYLSNHGVHLCGFLDQQLYIDTLGHCDVVVVLTKKEHILNCGAYEALSLTKPLVVSDTNTLRSYFGEGPVYANPYDVVSIETAITFAAKNKLFLESILLERRNSLNEAWDATFHKVRSRLGLGKAQ